MKDPDVFMFFRRILVITIFLYLAGVCSPVYSQPEANLHQWSALTLFNGLPSNSVRAIAQTEDGILWFGTEGGLAKLDGQGVRKVSLGKFEGLGINVLASDGERLWIGTTSGVVMLSDGSFEVLRATSGHEIKSIVIGKNKITIAASSAIFSLQRGKDAERKLPLPDDAELKINAIAEESDGNLLVGSAGRGLLRLTDGGLVEITSRPRPYFINTLDRDPKGLLWLGANTANRANGLFTVTDIERPSPVQGTGIGTVTAISFSPSGEDAWIGTDNRGLFLLRNRRFAEHYSFANTAGGLRSNRIYAVFVDRENTVWVGGDRGVSRFDIGSLRNVKLSDDKQGNFVRVLFENSDGRIFAGTNRGVFIWENESWLPESGFAGETVYALGNDLSGGVLVGSRKNLGSLDGKGIIEGDIRGTGVFRGKLYAAVYGKGLVTFDEESREEQIVFRNDELTAVWSNEKEFLLGTGTGEVYSFNGESAERFPGFEKAAGSPIWKIRRFSKGLILATQNGLFVMRGSETTRYLGNRAVRDGFIAGNGADIWAATVDDGLFHLRKDDRFGLLRSNLGGEQGLPSPGAFAILQIEDDQLLIGTTNGVSYYRPDSTPPRILPVRLLSQRLHSVREMNHGIRLEYPQNSILLEVSGLSSRTSPEKFQYAFLLRNAGGDVLRKEVTRDSQFVMDELEAGSYEVEAYAFNQDLVQSDSLKFGFSVSAAPFPWTSAALAALLTVALIALGWAFVESRRIADVNRKLTAARLDLAEEAERERRRIARDLHDQTLADLRNLMLASDKLPGETSSFRGEIESVSEEIRRICEDLSPSVLENVGLRAALEFLLAGDELESRFVCSEESEARLTFSAAVNMQIFRISQEVLTNIRRHADASRIEMTLGIKPGAVFELDIADDGKAGFDPDDHDLKGRGVSNIRSRADLIEAEIYWKSSPETGMNVFRLRKPIRQTGT